MAALTVGNNPLTGAVFLWDGSEVFAEVFGHDYDSKQENARELAEAVNARRGEEE